jgi:hypothetical protein
MPRGGLHRRWFALATLALAWIAPGPAGAADGAVAVYTGVEPSALASAEVASLLARLDPPVGLAAPPVHLTRLLSANQVRVVGDVPAAYCEGEAFDPSAQAKLLPDVQRELDEVRLQAAEFMLLQLADMHACYTSPPPGEGLARESFLAGILAFYRQDAVAAGLHFRLALARYPDLPWDEDYPPSAQQWFAAALLDVLRAEPATLSVDIPPGRELWIDGFAHAYDGSPIQLRPGRHLVQVGDPDAGYSSVEIEPVAGASATLLTGEVLERPDLLVAHEGLVVELIGGEVATRGLSEAYLIRLPGEIWRVDPYEASLVPVEAPAGALVTTDGPRQRVHPLGPVLTAIGAALAVGGGVLAGVERKQALALHGELEAWTAADGPHQATLDSFESHRSASYAGWGLLAGGGACIAVGIPLTLKLRRPVEVTAAISTTQGPDGHGWGFQLNFQPVRRAR